MRNTELKIKINEGEIHLKKWEPSVNSGAAPIVMLHDSLGSVELWRDFPEILANELSRTVFAYDRLGFGKSDARDELPSKEFVEEESITFFPQIKEKLSLNKYVLFGHSVGGGMAINIASRDTDCLAVITVSAQAFVEDLTANGIREAKKMFEQPGQIERLEKWHGSKAKWVLHAWTDVWLSDEFKNWSLDPAISNVQCPVLAIHGDRDEYGSKAFPEFISTRTGSNAEMLIIKDCGHMPHKEKTNEVIRAAKEFLKNVA